MISLTTTVLATLVLLISKVHGSSMPVLCTGIECEEGTMCVMVSVGECTPRFCPPPVPSCAPISSKPGFCPNRMGNKKCLSLRGAPLCLLDDDCTDDLKCCNGCCKVPDVEALPGGDLGYTDHGGMCPVDEDIKTLAWWTGLHCPDTDVVDECLADTECEPSFKCCLTLCGNRCKRALSVSLSNRAR